MDYFLKNKVAEYESELEGMVGNPPELNRVSQTIFRDILRRFQAGVENQGKMSLTLSLLDSDGRPVPEFETWPGWKEFCEWWADVYLKSGQNSREFQKIMVGLLDLKTRDTIAKLFSCWSHPLVQLEILDKHAAICVSIVI